MAYVGSLALCIPAVRGVVRHLIAHVLPESQLCRVHSHFDHVQIDPGHVVCKGCIGYEVLCVCIHVCGVIITKCDTLARVYAKLVLQ